MEISDFPYVTGTFGNGLAVTMEWLMILIKMASGAFSFRPFATVVDQEERFI